MRDFFYSGIRPVFFLLIFLPIIFGGCDRPGTINVELTLINNSNEDVHLFVFILGDIQETMDESTKVAPKSSRKIVRPLVYDKPDDKFLTTISAGRNGEILGETYFELFFESERLTVIWDGFSFSF